MSFFRVLECLLQETSNVQKIQKQNVYFESVMQVHTSTVAVNTTGSFCLAIKEILYKQKVH